MESKKMSPSVVFMSNPQKPAPRGRGALLLEAMRRASGTAESAVSAAPVEVQTQPHPPKSRGRAALLQKLSDLKTQSVGHPTVSAEDVQKVTESVASSTLNEPCYYQGSSGSEIAISCNYIKLGAEADRGVFEYSVQFKPSVDYKATRSKLIGEHVGQIRLYDGGQTLYIPKKLSQACTEFSCKHPQDDSDITMTITFVKHKRLGECLHLFNILFKKIMRILLYSRVGRNYFDPQQTRIIPQHKLEVLPGYAIAVDEYEGGVMVCLDTQHRVMRTENVLEALMHLRSTCREGLKEAAFKKLLGTTVLTKYNNRSYKIDDIVWGSNPSSTFETQDGRVLTYTQYYKTQYNIEIMDKLQPLLLNKQTKKTSSAEKKDYFICLIPELCYLTGLSEDIRGDFKIMKDIAVYTQVTPNQRINSLKKFVDNIDNNPDAKQVLLNWGLTLENATTDISARVLNPELILFGGGVRESASAKADWNAVTSKNKVLGPVDLTNWCVFYTPRDEACANNFVELMHRLSGPMGIRVNKPKMNLLQNDRTETYVAAIKQLNMTSVQILVLICPTARDDRYSAIKRLCCVNMPIPTQVINSRTLSNQQRVRAITQKIALQINCKLGGTLWSLRFPVKNWMICGIDVFHSPGMKESVSAFISSLNDDITRWHSSVTFQKSELGDQYKTSFIKALEKYRNMNGVFPTNVVIFRDGVGDGQLKTSRDHEVAQFQSCLRDFGIETVKLTVIIVQKRINTKVFLRVGPNKFENPQPGSVLDNTVTRRDWYDFFLISQNVRQGTVTPAHYIVIHDSANLKPDHVQKLAYKLCHLYYNWPGTIRVPAPCQYAHKLAYLVGQHIRNSPNLKLPGFTISNLEILLMETVVLNKKFI
ncbi:hypothetical protein FQA39_LY10351 [Lamprigera yunnana]|nr:hypothetical protein FQA39_LY10351 [Lamprigera yunnana]